MQELDLQKVLKITNQNNPHFLTFYNPLLLVLKLLLQYMYHINIQTVKISYPIILI